MLIENANCLSAATATDWKLAFLLDNVKVMDY